MEYTPRTVIAAVEWLERHCPDRETLDYFQEIPLSEMDSERMDELVITARFLGFPN